jgi:hypothetical protein
MPPEKPTLLTFLSEYAPYDMVSVEHLALQFHRSEETIRRWIKRGVLPPPVRFDEQDWFPIVVLRRHILKRAQEAAAIQAATQAQQAHELAALERKVRHMPQRG